MRPLLVLLAFWLCASTAAAATEADVFQGAGSSAAQPIYASWAEAFSADRGARLQYDPAGSGAGIKKLLAREVDFGASDLVPTAAALNGQDVVVFPTAITGAVPVVNLPGLGGAALRLDGPTLAGIFLGEIRRWNDPAIRGLNPQLKLPDRAIQVVTRSDGSGTTWNFADYLSKVSPRWKERYGVSTRFDWWQGVTAAKGSGGVVEAVASTPGAIGYVDYNYVVRHRLDAVVLRNRAGRFATAGTDGFAAALGASPWPRTGDFSATLTDQPGAASWPITMGTFILVPRSNPDRARASQVVKFFTWAFMHGDDLVKSSHFVRLPDNVQAKAFRALTSVADAQGNSLGFVGLTR